MMSDFTIKVERSAKRPGVALLHTDNELILSGMKGLLDGKKKRGNNTIEFPENAALLLFKHPGFKYIEWECSYYEDMVALRSTMRANVEMIKRYKDLYASNSLIFDYDLHPNSFSPMNHQIALYHIINDCYISAILAEPGTGKTAPYLWAIDNLIKTGEVKKALIITLSTLKENVIEEASKITPDLKMVNLYNTSKDKYGQTRIYRILNKTFIDDKKNKDYDVYVANYESVRMFKDDFDDGYFDMVILDEAHRIGNYQSLQTKAIIDKFENVPRKHILTGTLHGNNVMSFFMPFRFLGPFTTKFAKFQRFREEVMWAVDDKKRIWRPKVGAVDIVQNTVKPFSIYFSKRDAIKDLPEKLVKDVFFDIGNDQRKAFNELKKDFVTFLERPECKDCNGKDSCLLINKNDDTNLLEEDLEIDCQFAEYMIDSALVLIRKLQQITKGYVVDTKYQIDDNGKKRDVSETIYFKSNPLLDTISDLVSTIPDDKKIIIWCVELRAARLIIDRLSKEHSNSIITGFGSDDVFKKVDEFKNSSKRIFIANPGKAGVGLNIQFATYHITAFIDYSYIKYDQMISRTHRKGLDEPLTIYRPIAKNTADANVIKTLDYKEKLSESLSEASKPVMTKINDIKMILSGL